MKVLKVDSRRLKTMNALAKMTMMKTRKVDSRRALKTRMKNTLVRTKTK